MYNKISSTFQPNDLPFDKSPFVEGSKKESESLQNKTENELESDAEMVRNNILSLYFRGQTDNSDFLFIFLS